MASPLDSVYEEAGRAWNVDPGLIQAIHSGESGFNDGATSPKGAIGRGQFMPDTARGLGITNPRDPVQAIFGTAKLMSQHLDAANNDVPTALRLYQGGPNRAGWGPQNAAYPGYIMGKYQQVAARRPAADPAAAGRDAVIGDAVGRARQGSVAAPGHDASNADLLGALTAGASSAPASAATGTSPAPSATAPGDMPSLSDADLLRSLTAGATPPPDPKVAQAANAEANAVAAQYSGGTGMGGSNPDVQMPGVQFAKDAASGAGRVMSSMGGAAAAGFGSSPLGLDDSQRSTLQRIGMIPPAGARGNMLQNMNEAVINPLAATADLAGRGIRALVGGAQAGVAQGGAEVGQPQLGRDLAALPEAFPFGFNRGVPTPPNRLVAARSEAPPIPASAAMDMADGGIPRALIGGPVSAVPEGGVLAAPLGAVTSQPLAAPANRLAPPSGQPGSLGAATNAGSPLIGAPATKAPSPSLLPVVTRSQAQDRVDQLLQHFGKGGPTDPAAPIIPGSRPTLAQSTGNAGLAALENGLRATDPHFNNLYEQQKGMQSASRTRFVQAVTGTSDDITAADAALEQATGASRDAAFAKTTPVDSQPVWDKLESTLAGPDGKRDAVSRSLTPFFDKLKSGDGLESDPQQLYGVRKAINDQLASKGTQEGADARTASRQLIAVRDVLDKVIESGAPGFGEYIRQYSDLSRPIDAMRWLQSQNITDQLGNIQLGKLDSTVKRLEAQQGKPGASAADGVTPDQITKLRALRDDMRQAAATNATGAVGSKTTSQLAANRLTSLATGGLDGAAALSAVTAHPLLAPLIGARYAIGKVSARGNALVQEELRNRLLNPPSAAPAPQP